MRSRKYIYSFVYQILVFFFASLLIVNQASANITGVHGMNNTCPGPNTGNGYNASSFSLTGNTCTFSPPSSTFVPHSGNYSVRAYAYRYGDGFFHSATTTTTYLDASKDLSTQTVSVSGTTATFSISPSATYGEYLCYALVDESGKEYTFSNSDVDHKGCGNNGTPLPPTPSVDTSCIINSNNALNIDLGTIERSGIPTTAGTSGVKHFPVQVDCIGGGNINVNMQLSYTALNISGQSVVQTSSNGLGVSVVYNNQSLSPTDVTPITFITGSNTLDLAFGAVRNPNVSLADIPTGAFSASAVVVLTQL